MHLMESDKLEDGWPGFNVEGEGEVEKGYPKFLVVSESDGKMDSRLKHAGMTKGSDKADEGRVYINARQYFDGVRPEVWEFCVGGYQVCEKWLKDRRGRKLSYDDIEHYQKITVGLGRTIGCMGRVDKIIDGYGGWPMK